MAILASCCLAGSALAQTGTQPGAQAAAGTAIVNIADMTFTTDGTPTTVRSNPASLTLAEVLDVRVTAATPTVVRAVGQTQSVAAFTVTNSGNGSEGFELQASIAAGGRVTGIAIDDNGDGMYQPTSDHLLAQGEYPVLAAGGHLTMFVIVDGLSEAGPDSMITASARARTGSGAAGTAFAGQGDGGGDAVVGTTGAFAQANATLTVGRELPTLVKSQTVQAIDGSTRALHDAVITYQLEAHLPPATQGVEIADSLPSGTQYVPGSLLLDGQPLSDATDGDAGRFDGSAIRVTLGDAPVAAIRTIIFKVKIQ